MDVIHDDIRDAIEACQVAAMCEKAVQSAANWKGFTED